MTKVSFEIYVVSEGRLEQLSEGTLASALDQYRERLSRDTVFQGALLVEAQSQPTLRVRDELWAAVRNLCFECIPVLLEEKPHCWLHRCQSADVHVVMIPLGDRVRLLGEDMPTISDAMRDLLPALFRCGVRFMELLEYVGGDASLVARDLQPSADRARNTLQKHAML